MGIKDNNISLKQDDLSLSIPIEDVLAIILDDKETTITQKFITKCSEQNIILLFTDEKHLPSTAIIPFGNYSKPLLRLRDQINQSDSFKKKIWRKIIKSKIINQSDVLFLCNKDGSFLKKISDNVKIGDKTNLEAYAASEYFKVLFGEDFNRNIDCQENFFLNYSYAIVRGVVARNLMAYGFNCSLGIKHHNQYNAFNLADDFIEPFRPLIDLFIIKNINKLKNLDISEVKKELLNILNMQILWNQEKHRITTAIERVIISYIKSIESQDINNLVLPNIMELSLHKYEK